MTKELFAFLANPKIENEKMSAMLLRRSTQLFKKRHTDLLIIPHIQWSNIFDIRKSLRLFSLII